jgi:hypothetical protein
MEQYGSARARVIQQSLYPRMNYQQAWVTAREEVQTRIMRELAGTAEPAAASAASSTGQATPSTPQEQEVIEVFDSPEPAGTPHREPQAADATAAAAPGPPRGNVLPYSHDEAATYLFNEALASRDPAQQVKLLASLADHFGTTARSRAAFYGMDAPREAEKPSMGDVTTTTPSPALSCLSSSRSVSSDTAEVVRQTKLYDTNMKYIKRLVPLFYGLDLAKAKENSEKADDKGCTKYTAWLTSLDIVLWEKTLNEALDQYPVADCHENRVIPELIAQGSAAARACARSQQPGGAPFTALSKQEQIRFLRKEYGGHNRNTFYYNFSKSVARSNHEVLADWFTRALWFACAMHGDEGSLLHGATPSDISYQEAKRLILDESRMHNASLSATLRQQALQARTSYPADDREQYIYLQQFAEIHDTMSLEDTLASRAKTSASVYMVSSDQPSPPDVAAAPSNTINMAYTDPNATPFVPRGHRQSHRGGKGRQQPRGGRRQEASRPAKQPAKAGSAPGKVSTSLQPSYAPNTPRNPSVPPPRDHSNSQSTAPDQRRAAPRRGKRGGKQQHAKPPQKRIVTWEPGSVNAATTAEANQRGRRRHRGSKPGNTQPLYDWN